MIFCTFIFVSSPYNPDHETIKTKQKAKGLENDRFDLKKKKVHIMK